MTTISNQTEANAAFRTLRQFIGATQIEAMSYVTRAEEKQFVFDKLGEMVNIVSTMPKTYETDGQGQAAVVYLHYFINGFDWYITEKDMEREQLQAFGLADMGSPELGYISIVELLQKGVELDLHWTQKKLSEIHHH